MFDTILVANRGEIACRITRTAQDMGITVVAVYSDADAKAAHVALADHAVHIGGPAPAESYLCGDRIIQAALGSGAQAIHPGYGFLSENPDFVAAVEAAGLTFIGPSAEAIRKMGLKDAAKVLMEAAGVPVVPGYHGVNQDPDHLAVQAAEIGYPVLIKAVAGGGGKGMRQVDLPEDFSTALQSARNEAQAAFGHPDVLIEKYITAPRHIEVQIFGDGENAIHLYERDCSLQRRHQKVIEEAPAPGMTDEMRQAMGDAAVRAARAIGYKGAGTVEFIVDGSDGLRPDRFWFMEMNTRLQVEHPVTEAITGIDLVAWQLRIAAGEPLPNDGAPLPLRGHAFEARLYAEDVPKGFLPATGRLSHLQFPDLCRADTGVRSGDSISPYYDPMVAKIITHGPTRAIALARMRRALAGTEVAGTVTNLRFLAALCAHDGFAQGEVDTGLIARDLDSLTAAATPGPELCAWAALVAAELLDGGPECGFALWYPLVQSVPLRFDGREFIAEIRCFGPDLIEVAIEDALVTARRSDAGWKLNDRVAPGYHRNGAEVTLFAEAGLVFLVPDPLNVESSATGDRNLIDAPMPGQIKAMLAEPGQRVEQGDRLALLEAMKMEHALLAPRDGVVAECLASTGDQVEAGAALIRLEDEP